MSDGPVGILAGGGGLPLEIARCIAARGRAVHIVAIDGEADADFAGFPVVTVNWGQIGRMVASFRQAGARDLVIVGRVKRPDLGRIRPDLGLLLSLPSILKLVTAGGDDGVLRRVVRFFEGKGLRVLGPGEAAPEIVAGEGRLARLELGAAERADADIGLAAVAALGAFDIGQAAIVRRGRLVALEGAEGTDGMLRRFAAAERARQRDGTGEAARGGVLVKRPKPGQELRIDMPVIGPDTVTRAAEAGLPAIVVAAGNVLIAERAELGSRADAAGIAVAGVIVAQPPRRPELPRGAPPQLQPGFTGSRRALAEAGADAARGRAVIDALAPYCSSRGVVVVRRHVLGVETGEGLPALLERVAGLRQWGDRGHRRRGVLVAGGDAAPARRDLEAAARIGLAGVVLTRSMWTGGDESFAQARSLGLGLATVPPGKGQTG